MFKIALINKFSFTVFIHTQTGRFFVCLRIIKKLLLIKVSKSVLEILIVDNFLIKGVQTKNRSV